MTDARPAPPAMSDMLGSLQESTATVTDNAGTAPVPTVCDQAARLARTLAEHGVGPDTRVGVCADRGIGMLTALLGVWWAGGAIVALEPDSPRPRLEVMARDAGLRLVVADGGHAKLAGSLGGDLVVITLEQNVAEPLDPVMVPGDSLAYTVFISGSARLTGVDITRRGLANVLAVGQRDLGLGPGDRFVAVTTAAFDIALLELLLPLLCGTSLVISAAEDTRDASRLRSLIERNAATALHATPRIWRLLLRGGDVPARLRVRLCSGDRLPPDLAASLAAPDAVLWHFYGHSETTMWTAGGVVAPGEGPVVIGPPIDHARVYVLDGGLAPVPVGVTGEVHIAGAGVARGYLGDDGHMSTAFCPDPWEAEPGARMYATGDLGRWREDGGLELAGVADRRVTIRGVRVDCGEVEAALPAPEWAVTLAGPGNPVEATMIRIWADLLGSTEPIGVHENLFVLGGGSLAAVRFAARIADTYGVYLAIHRIVAMPTIAALAEIVSADLDSARIAGTAGGTGLAALSDEELDDLLRALFVARDRRRAARMDGQ